MSQAINRVQSLTFGARCPAFVPAAGGSQAWEELRERLDEAGRRARAACSSIASRCAESQPPRGPITASSVNQLEPMFTPVRAGTRLDGRRGFASESSRIDWSWPEPASEPASRSTCALWSTGTTDPGGMRRRAAARTEEPPRQDTQHALGATARLAGPPGAQDTRPAGAAEADDGSSASSSNSSTRVT